MCILHIKYVYLYIYIYIYTPIYVYVFPIENMFDPYVPMDFPILKNLEPRRTTPPGMTNRNTTIIPLILSCAVYSIFFCASYCMHYIYKYIYIYTHLCIHMLVAFCVLRRVKIAQGTSVFLLELTCISHLVLARKEHRMQKKRRDKLPSS